MPPSKTYVVKKGDSLYKIAKAEKVTVEQLARANNLSNTSRLQIGQTLVIPAPVARPEAPATPAATGASAAAQVQTAGAAGETRYEVKPGDSLWKIAKENGVTVAALKKANNLSTDKLRVGQKLVIPPKNATTGTVATTSAASGQGHAVYVVGASDTLQGIAQRHGVKVEDIVRLNNLTGGTRLTEGRKLLIPQAASATPNPGPAVIAPNLVGN
ncbi:MAG: LysM peptidoglycan-binding domain-containing protein [Verrucomicrobiae bacterium]|nr:LysM peptidoglycan-binding domain-containing protein [Verrucomicrobiae bacterium]